MLENTGASLTAVAVKVAASLPVIGCVPSLSVAVNVITSLPFQFVGAVMVATRFVIVTVRLLCPVAAQLINASAVAASLT